MTREHREARRLCSDFLQTPPGHLDEPHRPAGFGLARLLGFQERAPSEPASSSLSRGIPFPQTLSLQNGPELFMCIMMQMNDSFDSSCKADYV
jgi:hypothetical protein